MKQCNHATCDGPCRRPAKPKPLRRKIKRFSVKRERENREYSKARAEFLKDGDLCEMKTPACTAMAVCIHHVRGRVLNLMNKKTWKKSCQPCNDWVEANHAKAEKMGLKKSKFKIST
jgi:hypothetical protein